jgi:uncharacterized protein YyaL (SSP411 family)
MSNRLITQTSPYLLQHAENPVDWFPWGEEALSAAKAQDKPILLSIGYAACHWCHVMAHESFENPATAELMNQHFINIKVDREERPDIDSIYMIAVQMLTGQGGWPMTMFLTPEGKPFYGGTYFPPEDRQVGPGQGMPGFPRVLQAVINAYQTRRDEIEDSANQIRGQLDLHFQTTLHPAALTEESLAAAEQTLYQQFDPDHGGFGGAPKFPPGMTIEFLLRRIYRTGSWRARAMVTTTLDRMGRGGIFDQVGGGFHRYTVDAIWLVPHFEKMLYDNALLSRVYALAWQVTGDELYRRVANATFDYIQREMTSPEGGFYSSQDADSDGEEGKFYVWTPDEIASILTEEENKIVTRYFNIVARGNFEGANILSVALEPAQIALEFGLSVAELREQLDSSRQKLYAARAKRIWPGRDEKVLTAWNALMLRALADGGVILERPDLIELAKQNARFIQANLFDGEKLLRSYKDGHAHLDGYLEDYANLIDALISLYEATFDSGWVAWASQLADRMIAEFWDDERGGFFDTAASGETLIARPKEVFDSATPSGNSVAAEALMRLALLAFNLDYQRRAANILESYGSLAVERPNGFGRMLIAYDFAIGDVHEVAIAGDPANPETQALLHVAQSNYLPWKVVALAKPDAPGDTTILPLLTDRTPVNGQPAAYVCQHYVCQLPVTTTEALAEQLGIEGE